ncbi:major facilitator superfamily protein [Escherichia coli]|uniref:Major facilitator superfamily protein n=1 Tax=Escherichia coli TaxID=562 RepID=A0A377AIH3_ECOLX|nr:major facilitator superfamily protein [Escherichia coli]
MLPFLKAPADAPLMTDKYEIDARYRYWRRHILLTIWLGYALFYFTRKSFNAAVPEILANGVLSRSDIGLLATLFLHYLWRVEVCLRHCQRSLKCPLFYGDRAYRHGHYQHSVWLLDVAMGVCRALGAERLFPGLGVHRCVRVC